MGCSLQQMSRRASARSWWVWLATGYTGMKQELALLCFQEQKLRRRVRRTASSVAAARESIQGDLA